MLQFAVVSYRVVVAAVVDGAVGVVVGGVDAVQLWSYDAWYSSCY